ncbi:MAG TPA: P-loop NTPase [Elusimicrobiales bacterium]|nr:P-loop NTPase [Elusimicrobiales bacterium]
MKPAAAAIDPRPSVIGERLSRVKRVIAVTGWKGGIGKSVTAAVLALILSRRGFRTGLFDLDFAGASAHLVLGAGGKFPKEVKGIEPPPVSGVGLMSVAFFSGDKAVALRGADVSDAMLELLAVTQWGELDFLIMDMPPGINDAALDVLRLLPRTEVLAVTIPSLMAHSVLERSLSLYRSLKVPVLGVVSNMETAGGRSSAKWRVRRDAGLERALGRPERLLRTAFAADLGKVADALVRRRPGA